MSEHFGSRPAAGSSATDRDPIASLLHNAGPPRDPDEERRQRVAAAVEDPENLWTVVLRIDGFEIPKPYHLTDLQNLFSLVDASIIDRLDLYAGGFPVELGRAQSGVLDAYTLSPRERSRSGAIDDGQSRLSDRRELTEWSLSQDWSFEATARQRLKWG